MHATSSRLVSRSSNARPAPRWRTRQRLICAAYVLGLILVFLLSLLLLPEDAGLGKLLWSMLHTPAQLGA